MEGPATDEADPRYVPVAEAANITLLRLRPNCTAASAQPIVYIALNVSETSIEAPPCRTGQPLASSTAASRLSDLIRL